MEREGKDTVRRRRKVEGGEEANVWRRAGGEEVGGRRIYLQGIQGTPCYHVQLQFESQESIVVPLIRHKLRYAEAEDVEESLGSNW